MTKEFKLGLGAVIAVVLLLAITAGLNYYNYERSIIKEKDPKLSDESRKIYEDRLVQAEAELAKPDLTQDQRYEWLMFKSFQLFGLGKLQESMDYLIQASVLKPENPNPYVMMYTVQMDMQDNKGAHVNIKKALSLNPLSADAWKKYILLEKERFKAGEEQLINIYNEALVKTNNHVDVTSSYAVYLESIGRLQPAVDQWKKAIEQNPSKQAVYEQEINRLNDKIQAQ